ncbi:phosphotransferase [Vogesella sp. LIG4]|uniref:phosphotransferase n=1 Tax=Vogesella sp. LIG4 TaxID=1192162 RepID=UPI00081F7A89|nr:phosphotransferase [Vogesella sp. LIG4]SCK16654.1 Ser/Thr protein kinase RdoA involved in Cpx stress response, MazF antagonist [Vogesella sp. LIG4]
MSEAMDNQLFTTMAAATAADEVAALLWTHYRLRGDSSKLNSERDENFHIRADDGREYVLKLSHPAEDRAVTDFQTRALLHAIQRDPGLPIPQVIARQDGAPYGVVAMRDGSQRVLRLLSFLHGQPLHQVSRSEAQRRQLGHTLARLNVALSDFSHPAASHRLLWDIQHSQDLAPLLQATPAGAKRDALASWLAHFDSALRPTLAGLRRQVIHNDMNPYNVLVGADGVSTAGIIDFGDMVHAPLVDELAVACSYQLSEQANPLDSAGEVIAAYHAVNPLTAQEVGLLYDLILTRLCMTVTITGWRAVKYPENSSYILRNHGLSWDGMQRLLAMGRPQAQAYLHAVCGTKGQA